jgi:hypothetical protein
MYTNKLTPQVTQHTIYYNNQSDNVSVLTNPTMVVAGPNVEKFQQSKNSINLNDMYKKDNRYDDSGPWQGAANV